MCICVCLCVCVQLYARNHFCVPHYHLIGCTRLMFVVGIFRSERARFRYAQPSQEDNTQCALAKLYFTKYYLCGAKWMCVVYVWCVCMCSACKKHERALLAILH